MRKIYAFLILFIFTTAAFAQPTPKEHFGFNMGDDYQLATYTQTAAYLEKLAQTSDRTKLVDIGKTEEGRSQYMLIVSSPQNIKNLERYKAISQKLARAEGLTDEQAKALAQEGKAVVWIDGGLHATETVGAHQLIETAWNFVSRKDAETLRILDNTIILFTHANPDGQELVSNWYMRNADPKKRSLNYLPRLYEKYAGHDNNRDFFMLNLKETQNIGRQLFVEWIPQIMYNHHQAGPAGSVVAGAPYRDPFNYVFDPILMTSIDALGAAMNTRLNAEDKPGYTQKYGSVFSTWYNGGLRTTTYFHNMIGLLTEIVGGPTPSEIPLVPSRLIPNGGTPYPVKPQPWKFRQSIDYSVSLNYAVLNYATRYRDELLYNIYRMGKNSIEKGSKDTWGLSPKKIDSINAFYQADQKKSKTTSQNEPGDGFSRSGMPVKYFDTVMRDPLLRDPRGYIISADQPDFPTAVKFVNALIKTGIKVHKATNEFTVEGTKYPSGTFVVKTNQAFRPHVLDMFEPQDHPNDFKYEGGPPVAPYDAAGWTLAYTMNVDFDRILNDFTGPFSEIPYGEVQVLGKENILPPGKNFAINAASNNAFIAVNDLLKAKVPVFRTTQADGQYTAGTFIIPSTEKSKAALNKLLANPGLVVNSGPASLNNLKKISKLRIGIWDTYGGSMAAGWLRWIMEQYHFDAEIVYPQAIDAGNLQSKFDVIVFVPGAISSVSTTRNMGPKPEDTPEEYKAQLGRITAEKSVPQLKRFMEQGGNVITIGSSTSLAYLLNLPVKNYLTEIVGGQEKRLPLEKYYVPGSVLTVAVNNNLPSAWGMPKYSDVYFDNSPVFRISPDAIASGKIKPLAWFATAKPLKSGWAWGQSYLQDGVTAFEAPVGKGKLYAFGPEITFRAQTHGTFKLLFNQLYELE